MSDLSEREKFYIMMWERWDSLKLLPHQYHHKYGKFGVMYEEHINALTAMKSLSNQRMRMEQDMASQKAAAKSGRRIEKGV